MIADMIQHRGGPLTVNSTNISQRYSYYKCSVNRLTGQWDYIILLLLLATREKKNIIDLTP